MLDLTSTFLIEGGNWRRWWARPHDADPNAAAAGAAARALLEHPQERGWIRAGPSDQAWRDSQHYPEPPASVEPSRPLVRP